MIINQDEILSYGDVEAKRIALEIVSHAISKANPYDLVRRAVKLEGSRLVVEGMCFDFDKVYVVAIGKAACPMAKAIEDVLKDKIAEGVAVTKYGYTQPLERIEVIEAGHPIPNENSMKGAMRGLEIAKKVKEKDLLLVLVSGGGSALFVMPEDGISLEDKIKTNELLLKSGAKIHEINTVRKHISKVKGGKFIKGVKGKVVALIISDVVGDNLEVIASGITVKDPTTFEDAYRMLKLRGIWEDVPESVKRHIELGMRGEREETLKEDLENVHNFLICGTGRVCEFALEKAKELGLDGRIMTTTLEGEAKEVGTAIASIVQEIARFGRPFGRGVVLIFGGETTVTIRGKAGRGGPNQELALSSARKIAKLRGCCIASIDTDGTDGPTDAAGGIVDSYTLELFEEEGMDVDRCLIEHDAYECLKKGKALIFTGPTKTNVNSMVVAVIV